jgi:hypothetical protein
VKPVLCEGADFRLGRRDASGRAPVLTLWAAVVAERLGHPADTALTLGRAVAGSAARVKARNIGREERRADRDSDRSELRPDHVTAPVFLSGKTIQQLPTTDGELRAAEGEQPADPMAVQRYLAKAFGDHLNEVRQAMDELSTLLAASSNEVKDRAAACPGAAVKVS